MIHPMVAQRGGRGSDPARSPRAAAVDSNGTSDWAVNRRGEKMAEKLAHQIVDEILESDRQPGDMLPPETSMIGTYQVGRATLREALRLLEVQGLVHMKPGPGGGPMVGSLTSRDFASMAKLHLRMRGSTYREVLEARLAIEPIIARLAAGNKDPEKLAALREVVVEAETGDLDNARWWHRNSNRFHEVVAGLCGNSVLDLLCVGIRDVYITQVQEAVTPPRMRREVRSVHKAIADAIIEGRAADAEELMREHMSQFAKRSGRQNGPDLDQRVHWN